MYCVIFESYFAILLLGKGDPPRELWLKRAGSHHMTILTSSMVMVMMFMMMRINDLDDEEAEDEDKDNDNGSPFWMGRME